MKRLVVKLPSPVVLSLLTIFFLYLVFSLLAPWLHRYEAWVDHQTAIIRAETEAQTHHIVTPSQ